MVLPAGYDTMTPQQHMLWLLNSEREARGIPDLQLDPTLMSQIALNHGAARGLMPSSPVAGCWRGCARA
jgi:hypothetical protein